MIAIIYDHKAPIFSKMGCLWTTKLFKIVKMALKPDFRATDCKRMSVHTDVI